MFEKNQEIRLLQFISASLKFTAFFLMTSLFVVHHSFISLLIRDESSRLRYFLRSIKFTAGIGLRILNIKVDVRGRRGPVSGKFIVSNHLSYIDVLILSREFPSLFITSTEIRDTFLLGRICKLAGCFFVERRREKRNLSTKESELKLMREKFEQGFNIFLFPEGTSSDGQKVLPFKGTFFQLAVDTNTPVQPICLKYIGVNADFVPWYGNMTFPDHLFNLCLQNHIIASVEILDTIEGHEKMKLARISQSNISEAYA